MCLPERDGDKLLTLTAAVAHRFNTEAAILDDTMSWQAPGEFDDRQKWIIPKVTTGKQKSFWFLLLLFVLFFVATYKNKLKLKTYL